MTLLHPIPPLTSFRTQAGRLYICPTQDGVYVSVDQYGANSQELTLSREQALDLRRRLQQKFAGKDS